MKRFILCLILLCASVCCGDEYLGSWKIDDYVTITVTTHQFSTGAAYAATGNVLLDIYEDATDTEIVNDTTMSNFDSRTGLYQARVQLTAGTGFEKGKHYTCVVAATVDGVAALWTANFQIEAEVDSQTNSGTVTPAAASITAATIASNAFTSDELDTTFIDELQDNKMNNNNVKHSWAWYTKRASGSDPVPVEPDATAQAGGTDNTIVLAADASSRDNAYAPMLVELTEGTGAPANATIVAYNGTNQTATVSQNWPNDAPDETTHYKLTASPTSSFAHEGLAQAGAPTTITLASEAPSIDDIPGFIVLRSGTGAPDTQEIASYNGTTKVLTVSGWTGDSPDGTTYYALIPTGDAVSDTPEPTPSGLTISDVQSALTLQGLTTTLATNIGTTNSRIGDPNSGDTLAGDLSVIETMVDGLETAVNNLTVNGVPIDPATGLGYQDVFAVGTGAHTGQVFYMSSGPATDNYYGSMWVAVVEDADTGYKGGAYIQSYLASSNLVVLKNILPFTPAENDVVWIIPLGAGRPEFDFN